MTTELENIRKNKSSFWPYIIIGLILIGMVFFGASDFYQAGSSSDYALKVGKERLSTINYQNSLQNEMQRQPERKKEDIELEVKQRMINQLLLLDYAKKSAFLASDNVVANSIRSKDFFQKDGKFSPELYISYLNQARITAEQDAEDTRENLSISELLRTLSDVSISTNIDYDIALALAGISVDAKYFLIDKSDYELSDVSEESIKEYYDTHPELYQSEEKISLSYIMLDVNPDIVSEADIDIDKAYSEYVSKQKNKKTAADYWLFSDEESAKDSIEKIKAGTFDESSLGDKFLDMGHFSASDKKPDEVQKAIANISNVNDFSDSVKTEDGYFVLKLTEHETGEVKPLDDVKDDLIKEAKREMAEKSFEEKSELLESVIYENGTTLEKISETLNIDIKETGNVAINTGGGILTDADMREIISSGNFKIGELADPVVKNDKIIVYKVNSNDKPSLLTYDEVREKAEADFKRQSLREAIETAAKDIKDEVKEKGIASVASEKGYKIETISDLNYKTENENIDLFAKFAILKNPENIGDSNANYTKTTEGNILMFVIDDVKFSDVDEKQVDFIKESILRLQQQDTIVGFLEYLNKTSKVVDNTEGL